MHTVRGETIMVHNFCSSVIVLCFVVRYFVSWLLCFFVFLVSRVVVWPTSQPKGCLQFVIVLFPGHTHCFSDTSSVHVDLFLALADNF